MSQAPEQTHFPSFCNFSASVDYKAELTSHSRLTRLLCATDADQTSPPAQTSAPAAAPVTLS